MAFVVMDDHVHVVLRHAQEISLSKILHSWKTFTAYQLQRLHSRPGKVWQTESYDRIIRDNVELEHVLSYIANNPSKRWPEISYYQWIRFLE